MKLCANREKVLTNHTMPDRMKSYDYSIFLRLKENRMPARKTGNTKLVQVKIAPAEHELLTRIASAQNTSTSQVVREAIRERLQRTAVTAVS